MVIPASDVAARLAELYEQPFAGKPRGRFRISQKYLRQMAGVRRLYSDDISALTRALYELGYVFIDLDSFYVILSQKAFTSYRRVNEGVLAE
ncbi:hypothetical protein [Breoghania sp. L-A4]|uniref:hypothetical protein n=1 Tax=Breoghania sp. L-A4 TaxID=2304600 RepID=UPI000E357F25|nr:hypothetical protein [Breoghania sp. L-A4]AXS38770.1 hypothetical protein D1F64_00250 [Breoghania sp. L-A4]